MPKLTFFQLTKVFAAGFFGYALLVTALSLGTVFFFPAYVKGGWLDMSIHEFLKSMFYFFGLIGVVTASLMLVGAWCLLRVFRRGVTP